MSNKIIHIDPVYIKFRRMWLEDRWKFSGKLVNLTSKKSREALSEQEQYEYETLNRIVDEFDGNWLEEPVLPKRARKRG